MIAAMPRRLLADIGASAGCAYSGEDTGHGAAERGFFSDKSWLVGGALFPEAGRVAAPGGIDAIARIKGGRVSDRPA
jgi:hypothetical protein